MFVLFYHCQLNLAKYALLTSQNVFTVSVYWLQILVPLFLINSIIPNLTNKQTMQQLNPSVMYVMKSWFLYMQPCT